MDSGDKLTAPLPAGGILDHSPDDGVEDLLLPYAAADSFACFATGSVDAVLGAMT